MLDLVRLGGRSAEGAIGVTGARALPLVAAAAGQGAVLPLSLVLRRTWLLLILRLGVARLAALAVGRDPALAPGRSGQPRKGGRLHLLALLLVQAGQVGPAEPFPVRLGGRPGRGGTGLGTGRTASLRARWGSGRVSRRHWSARPGPAAGQVGPAGPASGRLRYPGILRATSRTGSGRPPVAAAAPPVTRAPTRATAASPAQRRRGGHGGPPGLVAARRGRVTARSSARAAA